MEVHFYRSAERGYLSNALESMFLDARLFCLPILVWFFCYILVTRIFSSRLTASVRHGINIDSRSILLCYRILRIDQQFCSELVQKSDCRPLRCLPNKWLLPFGLDKLKKVIEAENRHAYPLLMLSDHEKFGDTYSQLAPGLYTIITRDPQNSRDLLSRKSDYFGIGSIRQGCLGPLLGNGIFTQDGVSWEHSRRALAPLLQTTPEYGLLIVEKHFQRLLQEITTGSTGVKSVVVDLKDHLFKLTLNTTTEFLLGPSDAQSPDLTDPRFTQALDKAFLWLARRERLKVLYWLVDGFRFRESCRQVRAVVTKRIAHARDRVRDGQESFRRFAFAELLKDEDTDTTIQVTDQFLNMLLAGRDTSASLLCWIFYVLSREQDVFRRLRTELVSQLGNDKAATPTRSDLAKMKTLHYFVCETLRLFPPIPLDGRICLKATSLPKGGGSDGKSPIFVPQGALVAFSTFAVQNDAKWYGSEARKFSLDRWEDIDSSSRAKSWTFNPFGRGSRRCLGEHFAIEQAKYVTCRFIHHFERLEAVDPPGNPLESGSSVDWIDRVQYHVGLTMSPAGKLWLELEPSS